MSKTVRIEPSIFQLCKVNQGNLFFEVTKRV